MGSRPWLRWPLILLRTLLLLLLRSTAGAWELTTLHINDVHSRLEQTSEHSTKCFNTSLCVGGVARLFTKVQQICHEEPNILLLDAGDQYQGTIWFTVYKGLEVVHFMNILRYNAMRPVCAPHLKLTADWLPHSSLQGGCLETESQSKQGAELCAQ